MGRKHGLSFSWKRASGISGAKHRVSRKTGIPTTRSGRRSKAGKAMGCIIPILTLSLILILIISSFLFLSSAKAQSTTPTPEPKRYSTMVPDANGTLVEQCLIKGNINSKKDKIYHIPGWRDYEKTKIDTGKGERWFCTEEEAKSAGWRAPRNH